MMPIGPLMIEHRLIEKMIVILKERLVKIKEKKLVDPIFIDVAVDFIRTYADKCHHGKEEDILFRDLKKKSISSEHEKIMEELIQEHIFARKTTGDLVDAKNQYVNGKKDALNKVVENMKILVEFYPKHIEKEDKHFFIPVMEYFSKEEQDKMLQEFWDFDKILIHEKYKKVVEELRKLQKVIN